ncbi:MAG: amidohydrolase [Cyclobacteriaceae bacterium]
MSDKLNIGYIQTPLHWENIEANLAMLEEKVWQTDQSMDVIVLPEMFSTGFSMNAKVLAEPMKSKTFRWMKQIAAQKKSLVIGSYILKDGNTYRNRCFMVFPDGNFDYYDKRHLFSLAGEDESYIAGDARVVTLWKGWKIFPLICYDLRFPVWSRSINYEYDLMVCIANWPKPRINAWDTLLQARAIENQCYVVGVNRTGTDGYNAEYNGHSAVIDYLGKYIEEPTESDDSIKVTTVAKEPMTNFRQKYNFQKEADQFTIL